MGWGFWIELRGPARLWAASITFTILGALVAFLIPGLFDSTVHATVLIAIKILGWTFFVLGLLVLIPMIVTLYIRRVHPEQEAVWHWWINFVGGLLGALAFAIPATLMLPIFGAAYLIRPNVLFPTDGPEDAKNLGIATIFSIVGVLTLAVTLYLARLKLREEPKRED